MAWRSFRFPMAKSIHMGLPSGVLGSAGCQLPNCRSGKNPIKHTERVVPVIHAFWPALHYQKVGAELPKKNTPTPGNAWRRRHRRDGFLSSPPSPRSRGEGRDEGQVLAHRTEHGAFILYKGPASEMSVIPGLDPGLHPLSEMMDTRVKSAYDARSTKTPSSDSGFLFTN